MSNTKMTSEEMIADCAKYSMWSWSRGADVKPLPVERAEGLYIWTPEGKKILDFNSQLMSVNIGHGHPHVKAAMKAQIDQMCYVYPKTATQIRAKVSKRLAALLPGNLNTLFYTLGGAESNENAIKAARQYTGRHKILSRYRSYHGATNACMQLTGDPRRLNHEPGAPGFVKVFDPDPYHYSFGNSDEEKVNRNLQYLEEVLMYEGPHTIAAMFVETVTGSNGVVPPPKGYYPKLKTLLESHGILLVCDEVMCGFGRTGTMFACEQFGITPDILTMAKGLTSSYVPMGAMAVSDPIAEHFHDNVFGGGLTYNAHCLSLATADAVLDVMEDEKLCENAMNMGVIMRAEMERLKAKHPSVRAFRQIGLFGIMDIQNSKGELIAPYGGSHPAMDALGKFFLENGLFTFVRWAGFMCNPPLTIDEKTLRWAFEIIDRGLEITDAAYAAGE